MAKGKQMGLPRRRRDVVEVPSLRTEIRGATIFTERNDEGGKSLVFAHPAGQEWVVPMNRQQNFELANLLIDGGLELATEMPPDPEEGEAGNARPGEWATQ